MAVGLGPLPTLHPVAGFELGIASAGIKRPGRKDVVVMRCSLRGWGHGSAQVSPTDP